MFVFSGLIRKVLLFLVSASILSIPATTVAKDNFDTSALQGPFVMSLDGTFVSAPPPFNGPVLPFSASEVGQLEFDGAGLVWGEATLSFHHPDIPFGITSRIALSGTYSVAPNGRAILNLDEFQLNMAGEPAPVRSNSVVIECYVVQRQQLARCILRTLISYQQGPAPRNLPVTMSGELKRQT